MKRVTTISVVSILVLGIGITTVLYANAKQSDRNLTWDSVVSEQYDEINGNSVLLTSTEVLTDEQKVINDKYDELQKIYKDVLNEGGYYTETNWDRKQEIEISADEKIILYLANEMIDIFKKYDIITADKSVDDFEDARDIINMACNAINNFSLSTEEQIAIKFFVNQTYRFTDPADTGFVSLVEKEIDLSNIKYVGM